MAQPNLESFSRRALLLKVESTEGTDATPAAATDAFDLFDGKSAIEFDKVERKRDRPYFTGDGFGVSNMRGTIDGGFEIVPPDAPGTDLAACDAMLQIGGMKSTLSSGDKTTTYSPISTGIKSATAYWYHAGTQRKVLGARSQISGLALAVGSWLKAQGKVIGSCTDVLEASLPGSLDYTAFKDPVFSTAENSTLKIGTVTDGALLSTWGKELSIDFGTDLKTKEYTTKRLFTISDRKGSYKLRMARTAKSDFDPWALMKAGTLITAEFKLLQGDDLWTALGFRGQIEKVDEVDIDGDYGLEISGPCIASDAGGDEFYITLGDDSV
jgi:hypothetical protein